MCPYMNEVPFPPSTSEVSGAGFRSGRCARDGLDPVQPSVALLIARETRLGNRKLEPYSPRCVRGVVGTV